MIMALLVFSVIVLFHEFGHFLLAKLNGIGVIEFSLGFGPRLLSWKSKKSGTRYSWKLIPFGGSCAMYGEFDEQESKKMLESEMPEVTETPFSSEESFFKKSALARISVVAAGPIFNFILALVCSVVVVSWAGYDYPQIANVVEGHAAEMSGIQPGDVITKIGDRKVIITRDILLYMTLNNCEDMAVEYKRYNEASGEWERYKALLDADHYYQQNGRFYSGMNFYGYRSATDSPLALIKYSFAEVRFAMYSVVDGLREMLKGKVSSDDIAGPVRIVTIIDDTVEQISPYGAVAVFMNVLNLLLLFSANLGIMNLLPFPALDGGRLVFLFWELITRKPVNQKVEIAINLTGMALLMALMIFVLFNDLTVLF